jgi:hypothetical protein
MSSQGLPSSFDGWQLGDVVATAKGAKVSPLVDAEGQPVSFPLTPVFDPLTTPFAPGVFDQAEKAPNRLSVHFSCTQALRRDLERLDEWTLEYALANSERLFRRQLSREELEKSYKRALGPRGSVFPPTVRCKLTVRGRHATRCWGEDLAPRPPPEDFLACSYVPKVTLAQLWFMGSDFGWVFQITDLLCLERKVSCPFERPPGPSGLSG